MRCIGTDAGVQCEREASATGMGLCKKHYLRYWRWDREKGNEQPACPMKSCDGTLESMARPVTVNGDVLRKRQCRECHREYLTLEAVVPKRKLSLLAETLLSAFSERTQSATDTPAAAVDGVDAASTSPTT